MFLHGAPDGALRDPPPVAINILSLRDKNILSLRDKTSCSSGQRHPVLRDTGVI